MQVIRTAEIVARMRELERMYPWLRLLWDETFERGDPIVEIVKDYDAYRTFTMVTGVDV